MKTSTMESSSTSQKPMDESRAETTAPAWKPLYRAGGAAALTIVGIMVIQIIVFIASPPPSTVLATSHCFTRMGFSGC